MGIVARTSTTKLKYKTQTWFAMLAPLTSHFQLTFLQHKTTPNNFEWKILPNSVVLSTQHENMVKARGTVHLSSESEKTENLTALTGLESEKYMGMQLI